MLQVQQQGYIYIIQLINFPQFSLIYMHNDDILHKYDRIYIIDTFHINKYIFHHKFTIILNKY